ncbi:hypothetical protein ASZ90_020038 [hydrocarbon metagenome]|uniref:YtxH domain-containing protein n=1 Tax=hydrocarbon metagenome TaxID=938273 RepID=A0A0W8E225_9ZZZZ
MKDMFSAVLLGAVIGAAATMFYMSNEDELSRAGRQLRNSTGNAINFLSSMGQDIHNTMGKQV